MRVIGAQHHRPLRVAVDRGAVVCPLTRRLHAVVVCGSCPHLQGSLDGPERALLCAAPARAAAGHPGRRRVGGRLVFDTDWPDEPD